VTSRYVNGQNFTLNYDAENCLSSVTGASTANFYYDADGKQVKVTVNGVTTYYIGNHYEVKNSVVTKYYFAGTTRLAVRTGGTLSYLLGDHIGSSSVTTDANGAKTPLFCGKFPVIKLPHGRSNPAQNPPQGYSCHCRPQWSGQCACLRVGGALRQQPDSDIDFLVNLEAGRSLLDLARFLRELQPCLVKKWTW
jgi:hypothetical protein